MANINLSNVLDQDSGKHFVKEYLDKKFLPRRDWDGVLANSAYGVRKPLSYHEGQYIKFTKKDRVRRPETMASPGGTGSDPLCGISLGVKKKLLPIEYMHEYCKIGTVANQTTWADLEEWAKEDMPFALKRRMHELTQNAFIVGRMTPGVYAADGTTSTSFDASAETGPALYDITFSFEKAPSYYGGGKDAFADLDENCTANWADLRRIHTRLANAGAPKIKGGYMMVLSESMKNDLLEDGDGKFEAVINSGAKNLIKGLEDWHIASWNGWHFIIDDQPFTMDASSETARANFGEVHAGLAFGANAFGYMPLGGKVPVKPKFKVQDITLTGYEKSIGYLVPWQVGIIEPNWCANYITVVTESKPNNYDVEDPTDMLDGFGV